MENSRRKFFRQGLAGALLLGSAGGRSKSRFAGPDHSKSGEVNKPLAFGDGWLYIC